VPTNELQPVLPAPGELPIVGQAPRQRADALRNRERVLCTAARLFEEEGCEHVSMEAIAAAAGVGKGTLFRAFGDRAGLAGAVLGAYEARLQEDLIRGAAPLGPGAPPRERLVAFASAYLSFLDGHVSLILEAERGLPGARFRTPPFVFYRTHVLTLLREAEPGADPTELEYLADVLLGALGAEFFFFQRRIRERSLGQIADGYRGLVQRLLSAQPS
jgi:AcrR family transcriptional regulator